MSTATKIEISRRPFTKIVRVGSSVVNYNGRERSADVFCEIEYRFDGRLSITGVEGPLRNGDSLGAFGQIVTSDWNLVTYAPGWDAERVAEFRRIWERWHLNDMRAGCEHQRANWPDPTTKVEIVTYKLTSDTLQRLARIKERVMADLKKPRGMWPRGEEQGAEAVINDSERDLLSLPYETTQAPDADGPGSGCYEVAKRETKAIGWVKPSEHPQGLLCKACEECGYKYGSQWLREDVPAEVLSWLRALPDADVQPPWV